MNEQQLQVIYDLAHRRGVEASYAVKPSAATAKGTAWIVLAPGSEFSNWSKVKNLSRKGSELGREISCSRLIADHLDYKKAYANAFVKVLNDYSISASVKTRVD